MASRWSTIVLFILVQVAFTQPSSPDNQQRVRIDNIHRNAMKIPGPKSLSDKIAIVGGGPSGIHMAYKLKKAGFKNVVVFEQSDEVGGKSRTIYHRGVPHEFGTCYGHPDYEEIYDLVRELDAGEILPMPAPDMWVDSPKGKVPLSTSQYYGLEARRLKPDLANGTELAFFMSAIRKYVGLHRQFFGEYEGMLMPRPSRQVLAATNMTFLEFLRRNDIEILKALFLPAATMQGYGHVDEISALYAMMWLTPKFLLGIIPRNDGTRNIKILSKGFQFLWQEMKRQHNLNVKLNSPVLGIIKSRNGFRIVYKDCDYYRFEKFDFLMLTPTLRTMAKMIQFNREENSYFKRSFDYYIISTLVDTTYGKRSGAPTGYYVNNILSKIDNLVWGFRDSYASIYDITGANYSSGIYPGGSDGKKVESAIYYQEPQSRPNRRTAQLALRDHIENVYQAKVVEVQKQVVWENYFPRFSVADMASGILWDILDMQGKYGIWYLGSSVSFESLTGVMGYNNLILKHYDIPTK
ncbi:uncharacterized protein [Argopecten irradians]|uniref:uncharacterized protein n=1 Tax=Argopecten irradians TaxID=31199 RepID=UPI00372474FF